MTDTSAQQPKSSKPKSQRLKIAPLPALDRTGQVMERLVDYIQQAGLQPGARLPTERDLMASLGVGRSTVREVIRHFQALGVVESRKGSGTYLRKPVSADTLHMPLSFEALHERDGLLRTLEVRRAIEAEASILAARKRTPADLLNIERKLNAMERVHLSEGTSGPEDLAFHLAIYDATHNPLFAQLMEQMREAFNRFWQHPFDRQDFARRSFPYHRELFDAIVAQDTELARQKTLKILDIVEEDIMDMCK